MHGDALEDRGGGKEHAVVEGILGVQAMAKDDVGQLEGKEGIEVAHLLGPSAVTMPVVSSRLLERMMVLPTARDSSGSVSRVRTRMGRETWMLL